MGTAHSDRISETLSQQIAAHYHGSAEDPEIVICVKSIRKRICASDLVWARRTLTTKNTFSDKPY